VSPEHLKQAALEKLGVVPAGGPYPADDVEKVTQKYEALHAELREIFQLPWWITEDIPENVEEHVISMLAFRSAADFGVPDPRYTRLRREGALGDTPQSLAEQRMRQILVPPFISKPIKTEFF